MEIIVLKPRWKEKAVLLNYVMLEYFKYTNLRNKWMHGIIKLYSVQFSHSVLSDSLWPHKPQHTWPPCPSPTPRVHPTHVHQVYDIYVHIYMDIKYMIQPSRPPLSPSPPALKLSQHQSLFQWVSTLHHVAKVLEFQPQHQSFQWIFRTNFL